MEVRPMMAAEHAKMYFNYDSTTGDLVWKFNTGKKNMIGKAAASKSVDASGCTRLSVRIHKRVYSVPKVIWAITYGVWPDGDVDHINGVTTDNRLKNLRQASRTENLGNSRMHRNNKCGRKGVHWCTQRKKWKACVIKNRKKYHAGFHNDVESAAAAYLAKARQLYGDFATDRR
jgi:hypothetical protein